jgi:hypothetical protein
MGRLAPDTPNVTSNSDGYFSENCSVYKEKERKIK